MVASSSDVARTILFTAATNSAPAPTRSVTYEGGDLPNFCRIATEVLFTTLERLVRFSPKAHESNLHDCWGRRWEGGERAVLKLAFQNDRR